MQAITPVADYMGLCELIINDFCITITTNGSIVNEILARVLGTWCFKHIRNFRLIKVGEIADYKLQQLSVVCSNVLIHVWSEGTIWSSGVSV